MGNLRPFFNLRILITTARRSVFDRTRSSRNADGTKHPNAALQSGSPKRREIRRKPDKIIYIPAGDVCPICGHQPLSPTKHTSKRFIIDIVPRKSSLKKNTTEYVGFQGY